jgi:CheY-like chemotaxis protein
MILLVEDEALARRAFAQILRFEGHEVMEAGDGVEALILLEKYPFDLVITDLVMPHINGLSLIARIQVKWPKTAILLTSAYLTPQAAQVVLNGKPEFIHKPIDPPLLIETVQRLVPRLAS